MIAALLAALLRALAWTWRFERSGDEVDSEVVYAFLHGELLPHHLCYLHSGLSAHLWQAHGRPKHVEAALELQAVSGTEQPMYCPVKGGLPARSRKSCR